MPRRKDSAEKDVSASYDKPKEFQGKRYTGMRVGGTHSWEYDPGRWKERKVAPDKWEFAYEVPKRRRGKAPPGSGAPVGTEYHWYILADQYVRKLDANTYSTRMEGLKYKLAHKRAGKEEWSVRSERAARRRLLHLLEDEAERLRAELREEVEAAKGGRKRKAREEPGQTRLPGTQGPQGKAKT